MHNIIYRSPFNHSIRLINVSAEQKSIDVKHLKELIYLKEVNNLLLNIVKFIFYYRQ